MIGSQQSSIAGSARVLFGALVILSLLSVPAFAASPAIPEKLRDVRVERLSDGKIVNIGEMAKGKPFYLLFATATCPYCGEALTLLESQRDRYPDGAIGFAVIFPPGERREVLAGVLGERWGVKTIPGFVDVENKLFTAYRIEGVPAGVLFNARGGEVAHHVEMPPEEETFRALDGVLK